ncbi:hypothetical protein, partial [Bifidobacterium aquikefiri]|uniref:hypothetical protein n=1 Tax=Bifidobacterium aquikefiri TaxID=1653207 RepID=UPI0039EAC8E3
HMGDGWKPKSHSTDPIRKAGRGRYDPDTGLYEWYEDLPEEAHAGVIAPTWPQLIDHWQQITVDAQKNYQLEFDNQLLLEARPWAWLERRIIGLLGMNGQLRNALEKEQEAHDE